MLLLLLLQLLLTLLTVLVRCCAHRAPPHMQAMNACRQSTSWARVLQLVRVAESNLDPDLMMYNSAVACPVLSTT